MPFSKKKMEAARSKVRLVGSVVENDHPAVVRLLNDEEVEKLEAKAAADAEADVDPEDDVEVDERPEKNASNQSGGSWL